MRKIEAARGSAEYQPAATVIITTFNGAFYRMQGKCVSHCFTYLKTEEKMRHSAKLKSALLSNYTIRFPGACVRNPHAFTKV